MAPELQVTLRALECPALVSGVGLAERMPALSEQIGLSLGGAVRKPRGMHNPFCLFRQLTRGDPPHGDDVRPCCPTSRSGTGPRFSGSLIAVRVARAFDRRRAHGSFRGLDAEQGCRRLMMASGVGCLSVNIEVGASTGETRSSHRRPGGTTVPPVAEREPGSDGIRGQVVAVLASWPQRNVVASVQIRKRIMASLRATATAAFLEPLRAARRTPQLLSDEKRLTLARTTYAASYR